MNPALETGMKVTIIHSDAKVKGLPMCIKRTLAKIQLLLLHIFLILKEECNSTYVC